MRKYLGFVAVSVFLLSCADDTRDNPQDELAVNYRGKSSAEGSSSSVKAVNYTSSSSVVSSSSSVVLSSSSVQSSSSLAQSSSSSAPLCGEAQYNPDTEFCSGTEVLGKCGGTVEYNPATEFCSGTEVLGKCGGAVEYDPATEFCSGTEVLGKCGGTVEYNPATEACCGSGKYTKATQYCSNGTKKEYGSVADDNGKSYKTVVIGTQTWMAENLNYAASGSKCVNGSSLSDDNTSTCNTYGRLYNWSTAMALDPSCNSASCADQVQSPHRGVCPSSWHIPSSTEWTTLTTYTGGFNTAGTKLKAVSGWNDYEGTSGNGTDEFGFSALPGGRGSGNTFRDPNNGYWWTATEYNNNDIQANFRFMDYSNAISSGYWTKTLLFSVRCVKDY
jgi:uncharacterized protein (TIGR02145 family)